MAIVRHLAYNSIGLLAFRAVKLHGVRQLPTLATQAGASMLIDFRVENHRSIRDEQVLGMESTSLGGESDPRPRKLEGYRKKILPVAAIYGANASGKSNVLSALDFMREAVEVSHRFWDPESGVPCTPFAWGAKSLEPSLFEVTFLDQGTKFVYGFALNHSSIIEEWLYAWPQKHKQVWFEREFDRFKFGEHLKGPNDSIKEVTRSNALFLSSAIQLGHAQLRPVHSWFSRIFTVNITRTQVRVRAILDSPYRPTKRSSSSENKVAGTVSFWDENRLTRMRELLRKADVGISDIKSLESEREIDGRIQPHHRILLQHQANDDESWIDLEEESAGTKAMLRIAPYVFFALDSGGLLLIDELESSLHPLLGTEIVKMFHCPQTNPNHAQLIFTTHDTNFLGTTLGKPLLRRDQIWFTEKDKEGATTLYPLTDYKPRNVENLERGYLQGRYGAIPFVGNFESVVE